MFAAFYVKDSVVSTNITSTTEITTTATTIIATTKTSSFSATSTTSSTLTTTKRPLIKPFTIEPVAYIPDNSKFQSESNDNTKFLIIYIIAPDILLILLAFAGITVREHSNRDYRRQFPF